MKWQDITNAIVGGWLIIAAFLNMGKTGNLWNYLISGTIVLILSLWAGASK